MTRRGLRLQEDAVADVLGTILMVGITVVMTVGLGLLVFSMEGPPDRIHADVAFEVGHGSGDWGDGDETVTLRHISGEEVPQHGTTVRITVDGSTTVLAGSSLDGGFSDGALRLGETYTFTTFLPFGARVEALLVNSHANQVVGRADVGVSSIVMSGATTYVASHTANVGAVTDFTAAQSASDGDAAATLAEGSSSGTATATLDADGVNGALTSGWSDAGNAVGQDGNDATIAASSSSNLQLTLSEPGFSGDITQVVVKARAAIDAYANDDFQLAACFAGSCSTSGAIEGSAAYQTISYDVTAARPGGGSWTAGDFAALEARVINAKQAGLDGTFRVDHVWVDVTHATTGGDDLDIEFAWSGVPDAAQHRLQVRYRTTVDTYELQVWNGAWTSRGTLDAGAMTVFSHTLDSGELDSGSVRIRFVDLDSAPGTGTLAIDYARVVAD